MESIPYDKRSGKIWFNGKTVDWDDANVHILIMAYIMQVAFEGERVYEGEIFKLEEHTERLYSAKRMGINSYTQSEINKASKSIITHKKFRMDMLTLIW